MNAELPAFEKTLEDKAFAEALEEDGLPPLYPNQPRWAFEDGRGGAEAEAFAQRRSDAAFAHVKLLARRHRGSVKAAVCCQVLCAVLLVDTYAVALALLLPHRLSKTVQGC